MRSSALISWLICSASLASCVFVSPEQKGVTRITGLERMRDESFAFDGGLGLVLPTHQFPRDSRLDGGDSQRDEREVFLSFSPGDVIRWRDYYVIEPPIPGVNAVEHPFACRITPTEASVSYRRWRMFPCDNGLSIFMVSGTGEPPTPTYFLVSGYEPVGNLSSDFFGLPAVHIVELLHGETAERIDNAVRSAHSLWDSIDVLLYLLVPGLFLLVVLALVLLMPRRKLDVGMTVAACR